MKKTIGNHVFEYVGQIEPERDGAGAVVEFMPQTRYAKADVVPLHRYGEGPFCRLHVGDTPHKPGVYAILIGSDLKYVGMCDDLYERFGSRGYGHISPRNCFEKGQPTNCRINNCILQRAQRGERVELWFYSTEDRRTVESFLIGSLDPPWNLG